MAVPASIHDLLAPLSWADFLARHWGVAHLHLPGGSGKLEGLASWAELGAALEAHRFSEPRLSVGYHRRSEVVEVRRDRLGHLTPRLNVPRLHDELRAGQSLVLHDSDEIFPAVRRLSDGLGRHFGAQVAVSLFASGERTQSFGTHRDDQDQLILHIEGRKRWQLFGASDSPAAAVDELVLAPGDVLYLPRGHWHDVTSAGEPSLHLTCQIDSPTGAQLLRWMGEELCDEVDFRADLPRFAGGAARRAHAARLRALVAERFTDDLLAGFLRRHEASLEARPRPGLPHVLRGDGLPAGDFVVASSLPAEPELRLDGDEVVFLALGREWRLDAVHAEQLRRIFLAGPCRVAGSSEARELVAELVGSGLAHVVP